MSAYLEASYDAALAEIERLQTLNTGLCAKANGYVVNNARADEEIERLRADLSKQQSLTKAGLDLLDARKNRTNREIARLAAERDRALDRCAAMAADLDTPHAWHHLHHGLRYERGDGDGWFPLYMMAKPEDAP